MPVSRRSTSDVNTELNEIFLTHDFNKEDIMEMATALNVPIDPQSDSHYIKTVLINHLSDQVMYGPKIKKIFNFFSSSEFFNQFSEFSIKSVILGMGLYYTIKLSIQYLLTNSVPGKVLGFLELDGALASMLAIKIKPWVKLAMSVAGSVTLLNYIVDTVVNEPIIRQRIIDSITLLNNMSHSDLIELSDCVKPNVEINKKSFRKLCRSRLAYVDQQIMKETFENNLYHPFHTQYRKSVVKKRMAQLNQKLDQLYPDRNNLEWNHNQQSEEYINISREIAELENYLHPVSHVKRIPLLDKKGTKILIYIVSTLLSILGIGSLFAIWSYMNAPQPSLLDKAKKKIKT